MNQTEFGQLIKSKREAKKLTQEDLATQCQVNIRTIQRIEMGEVIPRFYTLKQLSATLEYDFNFIEPVNQNDNKSAYYSKRIVASVIDLIISFIIIQVIIFFTYLLKLWMLPRIIATPILLILVSLYFPISWIFGNGATIGMTILKIRVVSVNNKLTFKQSILRYLGCLVSLLPMFLGFLWAFFDRRNQGWHDKIAKTLVVSD